MMRIGHSTISHIAAAISVVAVFCVGCASIGSPDGGRYDDDPPIFKGSTPKRNATNVTTRNISLDFDEVVKIENAAERVIVSPPMVEQPDIQVLNKKIQIKIKDTLRSNTTYSIDFADAIVDNNEGNPLGDFCFSFSTGDELDTMEISGYVLDASNLEPVKGIQVGVYSDLSDTAFITKPFERISHTDAEGHFVIRGMKRGEYRVYALQDMDQNYYFSQKAERIAWLDSVITTDCKWDYRADSIRNSDGTVDSVAYVGYTRYLPDDIVLLSFKESPVNQYITSANRKTHEKFNLNFALPMDSLPHISGLNFDERDAFIIERSKGNDTLTYWMHDTLLYYKDTLRLSVTYQALDSMGVYVPVTDTLSLVPQKSRNQILKDAAKKVENDAKELEKEYKRLEKQGDSAAMAKLFEKKTSFLNMSLNVDQSMDVNQIVQLVFKEPVMPFVADSVIHVSHKVDSLFEPMPIVLIQDSLNIRSFNLYAEWRPGEEYQILVDSASIYGIYGLHNNILKQDISVRMLDQYSTFAVRIKDAEPGYRVQLYSGNDKVVRSDTLKKGVSVFYFMQPGTYYVRLLDDVNGNGVWDPGNYASGIQAERVFYLNKKFDLKANWEHEMDSPWDLYDMPLYLQKPDEAKQADVRSKQARKSKNIERDAKIAEQQAWKLKKRADRKERRLARKK